MTETEMLDRIEARVRTLADIIGGYDSPDDRMTLFLGNFRRVVGERERLAAAGEEMLRILEAVETQEDLASKSINDALWNARDELRSVLWSLTS